MMGVFILEIIKNIAAIVGCIMTCLGLLTTIIKPFRRWLIDSFIRKTKDTKRDEKIDKMDKKIDKLLENNQCLEDRLTRVDKNVLDNEADRIRAELFDCGNRCRRGIRLHPEEMEHIRAVYHKYKDVLNPLQNGTCIDIVPASVNKAQGIYALLDVVGGKYEDVIAVGDNINDTHMIAEFRSYAMANGVESIKELADEITESITELIYKELQ